MKLQASPKRALICLSIPVGVLLIDLGSKCAVTKTLSEHNSVRVVGDILQFTLAYNRGTTFGFFGDQESFLAISIVKFLVTTAAVICLVRVPRFINGARRQWFSQLCLLGIIGGSLANLVDRLWDRKVTDFLDLGVGSFRWYTFNVADAFQVVCGLALLWILALQHFRTNNMCAKP